MVGWLFLLSVFCSVITVYLMNFQILCVIVVVMFFIVLVLLLTRSENGPGPWIYPKYGHGDLLAFFGRRAAVKGCICLSSSRSICFLFFKEKHPTPLLACTYFFAHVYPLLFTCLFWANFVWFCLPLSLSSLENSIMQAMRRPVTAVLMDKV